MEITIEKHEVEEALTKKLVATAVEKILAEITPENMRDILTVILQKGIERASKYRIETAIEQETASIVQQYMQQEDVQAELRTRIFDGIHAALTSVPDAVKHKVTEAVLTGLKDSRNWR